MPLLVVKFGGASLSDIESIKNAASKVAREVRRGNKVVVVVAVDQGRTDELIALCRNVSPRPNPREYDAIISTGEQVSAGLMALALEQRGLNARSWTGWQIPIHTDSDFNKAHILDVDPALLLERLAEGEVAVVAGFQGLSKDGSITTLGRGGADITAVVLAAALNADRCDFYTNVQGVFTALPQLVTKAKQIRQISYQEMLELGSLGAKALNQSAIEIALRFGLDLQVLPAFGNEVGSDMPGTLVTKKDPAMENNPVTGISCSRDVARVSLFRIVDRPGSTAKIFGALARSGLNIGMIVQSASSDGKLTDLTFTVAEGELARAAEIMNQEKDKIGFDRLQTDRNVAKISLVGSGMKTKTGVAALMFQTLAEKNINIQVVETSEINITILVAEEYLELALRILHTAFNLDK